MEGYENEKEDVKRFCVRITAYRVVQECVFVGRKGRSGVPKKQPLTTTMWLKNVCVCVCVSRSFYSSVYRCGVQFDGKLRLRFEVFFSSERTKWIKIYVLYGGRRSYR